jgi:tripartite-type tricarboxylate transporter receptor subunit TctC
MTRIIDAARTAGAAVLALCCAQVFSAAAQDYPTRPITLIVPYPAGGGVDVMGRLVTPPPRSANAAPAPGSR